ncbi:MAG: alpha-glucan family phosphorylase [Myxococcales bacterium]|nr:alpha-glucan family phosphorylase [Myxococcales bacterium]
MEKSYRDPVCGMPVEPSRGCSAQHAGRLLYFCSDYCRREFFRTAEPSPSEQPGVVREARPARRIAYFSMEVAVDPGMPTYAGGLGVLAGDTLRSAADLRVPMVAVSLLHRKGHFQQLLDADGAQVERPVGWSPEEFLEPLPGSVEVEIERRRVQVRAWKRDVRGLDGYTVPVLFLDTDLPENSSEDRRLTDVLYGGDERYRLSQEIVLGIGGVRMLGALGYGGIWKVHLNEGHAALAALELLREAAAFGRERDFEGVRRRCVFTTHTPVEAGHDRFDYPLVRRVLGEPLPDEVLRALGGEERLNLTLLALNLSGYVNGVARKHEEVSKRLFPGRDIQTINNGVHSLSWTGDTFRALFDRYLPHWREDPAMLRKALSIPLGEIWEAHSGAKAVLLKAVRELAGRQLRPDALTIGFARRSTEYKRPDLVFFALERLRRIGRGQIQLVSAGKAHPQDRRGKQLIRQIVAAGRALGEEVPVVYLADYDTALARTLTAGVDLWLNTPLRPLEASGTSGMKAAHNGVPSLSVLDGWWIEGCVEGVTGWSIGPAEPPAGGRAEADSLDAGDLYDKLERTILPMYFGSRGGWISVMQHAIALNASFFNSHRMVQEYVTDAYLA